MAPRRRLAALIALAAALIAAAALPYGAAAAERKQRCALSTAASLSSQRLWQHITRTKGLTSGLRHC